ncbi:unnamed protein product [Calicophoron daubneyi]|uniref:Amidase domain-containing protein n=1 Tax=Calicophoron daubneyi TaxID=300641 RepID=A0AAV2TPH4_CALDB
MTDIVVAHWMRLSSWIGRHVNKKLAVSCGLTVLIIRLLREIYLRRKLNQRFREKQAELRKRIELIRGHLENEDKTDEIISLTNLSLSELRQKIEDRTVSPSKLLRAFQTKALQLYDNGNSGICEFISEAKEWASSLDDASHMPPVRSPLYGIPVSLKETICVKGYDSTMGLIKRCEKPNVEDCVLVKVLKKAGAIPFLLTSTSQATWTLHGSNALYGDTVNPYKKTRITGGSSSGEAVLLAQRGSPIGFGTDIAGGIRVPAAFCGLASLKPTSTRLSGLGLARIDEHSVLGIRWCPGPIANRVDDLADAMRTVLSPTLFSLDAEIPPMPFNELLYADDKSKELCIGVFFHFGEKSVAQPVSIIEGAVKQAAITLKKAGHRVVKFSPPSPSRASSLLFRLLFADGGRELRQWLAHEPLSCQLRLLNYTLGLPYWMKASGDAVLSLVGARPAAIAHTLGGARNVQTVMDLFVVLKKYRAQFKKAWDEAGPLDALICPASAFPAPTCTSRYLYVCPSLIYTAIYNLVDYPAGTVPISFVDEIDVIESSKMAVRQYLDGEWYKARVNLMQQDSEGLPVAVQVVGRPFCEETVLRVMRIIEAAQEKVEC